MSETTNTSTQRSESYPDAVSEHLATSHIIAIAGESSARVRQVAFVLMLFSAVMFTAEWNTSGASWSNQRYRRLTSLLLALRALPEADADRFIAQRTASGIKSRAELSEIVAELAGRRIDQLFVHVLGIGIKVDINDLWLVRGATYNLLYNGLLF